MQAIEYGRVMKNNRTYSLGSYVAVFMMMLSSFGFIILNQKKEKKNGPTSPEPIEMAKGANGPKEWG